jgi:predicted HD phosphohydrolase
MKNTTETKNQEIDRWVKKMQAQNDKSLSAGQITKREHSKQIRDIALWAEQSYAHAKLTRNA